MEKLEEYSPARKLLDPLRREDFATDDEFEEACNQLRRDFEKRIAKSRAEFNRECEEMHLASKKIHLPPPDPLNRARHYICTYGVLPCVKAIRNTTAALERVSRQIAAEVA